MKEKYQKAYVRSGVSWEMHAAKEGKWERWWPRAWKDTWEKKSLSGPGAGHEDKDRWAVSADFLLAVLPGSPVFQTEPLLSSPPPPSLSCLCLLSLSLLKNPEEGSDSWRGLLLPLPVAAENPSGLTKAPLGPGIVFCISMRKAEIPKRMSCSFRQEAW